MGGVKKEVCRFKAINIAKKYGLTPKNSTKGKNIGTKIINISVEEKPTGEIMAGAGLGTSGTSLLFGVKENNFLGQGVSLDSKLNLGTDSIKGNITINNPNYKNSDKSINFSLMATEIDRLTESGYKTNKTGFSSSHKV